MFLATPPLCTLPPDKLRAAIDLSRWRIGLYFGGAAWLLGTLWLLLRLRLGPGIERLAARVSPRPWRQGLVAAPAWLLILIALELPEAVLGHHIGLRYGLSIEPWPAWWIDWLKSAAISIVVGSVVLSIVYGLMRRSPRRWWIWFWLLTIPAEFLVAFIAPVVLDPLFNNFTPLAKTDPALVDQLERVAARGHLDIPPDRIFLMDASRRSTAPNAYVTGLGASKRIVVWDTTLRAEKPDEILFTYGHEQGHYVLHHVLKGLAWSVPIIFIFYWMGAGLLGWMIRQRGAAWGMASLSSWSSVGLILLVLTLLGFLADPIANTLSRRVEHQADVYGQEVIHGLVPDPSAVTERSFCSDARLWLDNPRPNPFVEFWTYSHPSTEQRAEFAARYHPWAPGHHPRYVEP